jgi:hypothetical protein
MTQFSSNFIAALIASTIAIYFVQKNTTLEIMQEAFDRGYAVECIGKDGYHWDCEE